MLTNDAPCRLSQAEFSDLVQDLDLSQEKAELLGSRLKQWNLLQFDVKVLHTENGSRICFLFLRTKIILLIALMSLD